MTRIVPRYQDTHPLALAVEFEGERPLPQPGWCDEQPMPPAGAGHAGAVSAWCDEQPAAPGWLERDIAKANARLTPQQTSDAAHADPARHNAVRLARLAEAWVENAMGLARTMERLREMRALLAALEAGHLRALEQREREALGGRKNDLQDAAACEVAFKVETASGGLPSALGGHVGVGMTDRAEWDPQP